MLGTRGIWHDGWFANTVHAASPAGWSHFDDDRWELFHIEADRSQCHDLAAEQPEKLEELKDALVRRGGQVQRSSAGRPQHLRDADALAAVPVRRPQDTSPTTRAPPRSGIGAAVELRGQSFSVLAEVTRRHRRRRGRAVQAGCRARWSRAVRAGRPAALRLQLHGGGRAAGVRPRSDSVGQPRLRGPLRDGPAPSRAATRRSVTSRCTSTATPWRRRRGAGHPGTFGLAGGGVAVGRNCGPGGVGAVPAAVRLHRRHHRQGGRRRLGYAVPGRRTRTGAGLRQGLIARPGRR